MGVNDLKKGVLVVVDNEPYLIMKVSHQHIGRGGSTSEVKMKNLVNGKVFERNFKPSDNFEEAEVIRKDAEFIYSRNNEYWFHEAGNPSKRFSMDTETLGDGISFLKPKMVVRAIEFNEKIISVELPIKVEYEVTEAPPNVRGNTAQGGTKQVTIETGAKIATPMFVETGDRIIVNTETGEYVERA